MLGSVLGSGNTAMNKIDKFSCPRETYFPVLYTKFIKVDVCSPCCLAYKMVNPPENVSIFKSLIQNVMMNETAFNLESV